MNVTVRNPEDNQHQEKIITILISCLAGLETQDYMLKAVTEGSLLKYCNLKYK